MRRIRLFAIAGASAAAAACADMSEARPLDVGVEAVGSETQLLLRSPAGEPALPAVMKLGSEKGRS
jgi:hypothetical protein